MRIIPCDSCDEGAGSEAQERTAGTTSGRRAFRPRRRTNVYIHRVRSPCQTTCPTFVATSADTPRANRETRRVSRAFEPRHRHESCHNDDAALRVSHKTLDFMTQLINRSVRIAPLERDSPSKARTSLRGNEFRKICS